MNPLDLTPEQIHPAFPGSRLDNIRLYWPHIRNALLDARLESGPIVAYALATIAAESAGFEPISEMQSRYNTKVRPFDLYDDRAVLGNTQRGDGAAYRGRGFIQLTGRYNYRRYGERIGVDLEHEPEEANHPSVAAKILALFIADKESKIMDALNNGEMIKARKLVNGGSHGIDRFRETYHAIMRTLRGRDE